MTGSWIMAGFASDARRRFILQSDKAQERCDELSLNVACLVISVPSPFVPSMNSGQALSQSKDSEKTPQQPGNHAFRDSFDSLPSNSRRAL